MMNISISHPVPTFGDSFTITCYVCGMPSSKEWAQKARSRPSTPMKPYFPFLLQITPLGGAILREDGSTYLCAFCHASLEAQWHIYESQQVIPPPNRKYNIQKFICAVCGVETYRKRIRALPFQEFPFLEKQRQSGSITLGNNPLAVVCLDCSETLWAQSAEYDRWGLPVHKRHFNWMARPPPPEDSVEATVARLPSGETQLPRCPPIEPAVVPVKTTEPPKLMETSVSAKGRCKQKADSPKTDAFASINSHHVVSGARKVSLTSTTPPALDMVGGYQSQQPPVVTVAPMSSHSTTVINLRKDSLTLPPGLIPSAAHPGQPSIYPQPSVFSPAAATYVPYVWGNPTREANQTSIEPYSFPPSAPDSIPGPNAWSWLAHPSPDLLRYQSYVSSLQSRSLGPDSFFSKMCERPSTTNNSNSPSETPCPSSSISYTAAPDSSSARFPGSALTQGLRERDNDRKRPSLNMPAASSMPSSSGSDDLNVRNQRPPSKGSPELKSGKKSPISYTMRDMDRTSENRPYPSHPKKLPKHQGTATSSSNSKESNTPNQCSEGPRTSNSHVSQPPCDKSGSGDDQDKAVRREFHIPKKRNWQVFMKDSSQSSAATPTNSKKVTEISRHPKKKKTSVATPESVSSSQVAAAESKCKGDTPVNYKQTHASTPSENSSLQQRATESAMDLSVAPENTSQQQASKGAGAKFMIEYLCKSEPSRKGESSSGTLSGDDSIMRTSVIRCAPKIPSENSSQTAETDDAASKGCSKEGVEESPQSLCAKSEQFEAPGTPSDGDDDDEKAVVGENLVHDGRESSVDEQTRTDESDNEGNSERKQQDRIHDDDVDDDRKNEDLRNVEQFIKETITELVNREKAQMKVRQESMDKQKQFLRTLGLITHDKRIELEIKSVVSRHERKTLPPLKLRTGVQSSTTIDKTLKELLLKVALEDPSLFQDTPESDKCNFMAELGMRTTEKSEKAKREMKWRMILMERIRREIRDAKARGMKHEWEKSDALKKFAESDFEAFCNSLTFSEPSSSRLDENAKIICHEENGKISTGSSCLSTNGVCIKYPKYIPSYAVPCSSASMKTLEEGSVVNHAIVDSVTGSSSTGMEPILKIPVVSSSKTRCGDSYSSVGLTGTSDSDSGHSHISDLNDFPPSSLTLPHSAAGGQLSVKIDGMIQSSKTNWEEMKRNISEILDGFDTDISKADVSLEEKYNHIYKIRHHLISQLIDMKGMEKRLRAAGRNIINTSRNHKVSKDKEETEETE